jgi:hypothetical protein
MMARSAEAYDREIHSRGSIRSHATVAVGYPVSGLGTSGATTAQPLRGRSSPVLLIGFALCGVLLAEWASRNGVGLGYDSLVYISSARELSQGRGLFVSPCVSYEGGRPAALGHNRVPLTHFPPLYPATLAALSQLGLELRDAARWLNVALFGVNLAIIGIALWARCSSAVVSHIATLWALASVDLVYLHAMALSEPLSLALGFGGLVTLAFWIECGGRGMLQLLFAAVLTGLAGLARYAGAAYLCAGAAALLAIGWAPPPKRRRTAVLFVGIAAVPLMLLALHNVRVAGSPANRQLAFHPLQPGLLANALATSASWIVPESLPLPVKLSLALGILFLSTRLYFRIRRAATVGARAVDNRAHQRFLACVVAWFVPSYLVVVIASKAFLDYGIRFDFRMLAPVHVALILLASLAGSGLADRYRLPVRFWVVAFGVLAGLLVSKCVVATRFAIDCRERGLELSSIERNSELTAAVRALPSGVEVYSNLSAMTAFLADRPVWPLAQAMNADGAYLAYYNHNWEFPAQRLPIDENSRSRIHKIKVVRDGCLYEIKGSSSRSATHLNEAKSD